MLKNCQNEKVSSKKNVSLYVVCNYISRENEHKKKKKNSEKIAAFLIRRSFPLARTKTK